MAQECKIDKGELLRLSCEFCQLPETRKTALFACLYEADQVIDFPRIPKDFFVAQNIAPLGVEGGQFMLLPKPKLNGHTLSLASLENQDSLREACSNFFSALCALYPGNELLVFEHGPGFIHDEPIACGGCHMDHAHANVVVLPSVERYYSGIKQRTEEILDQWGWESSVRRGISSRQVFAGIKDIAGRNPYVHIGIVRKPDSEESVTYLQQTQQEFVPSQLLRRVIANIVYKTDDPVFWNWQDAVSLGDKAALRSKVYAFRKIFKLSVEKNSL